MNSNTASSGNGGGIFNGLGNYIPIITMGEHAQVDGNTAGHDGGGIWNEGTLVGTVAGVNVRSNIPDDIAP